MYISVLILTRTKTADDYGILTANDLFLYSSVFNRGTYSPREGMIWRSIGLSFVEYNLK